MDSTAPPAMDGQGAPQHQQHAYDPRNNGLTRQPTDPLDTLSTPRSQSLTPQDRTDAPVRSMTDPLQNEQHQLQHQQQPPKPKRSGKICGKCGEGLTGQFVRALGGTYHLECFTCHVGSPFPDPSLRVCTRLGFADLCPLQPRVRWNASTCRTRLQSWAII